MCTRTGVLLLLIAICGAVDLEGRWNEDQYKRTGLHSYLYAIGKKICLYGMGIGERAVPRDFRSVVEFHPLFLPLLVIRTETANALPPRNKMSTNCPSPLLDRSPDVMAEDSAVASGGLGGIVSGEVAMTGHYKRQI